MPEHARIRGTAFTHAADELLVSPELREREWSCIGCDANMAPVAWDPKRKFKTHPHFRLELGCEHFECDGDRFRSTREKAYTGRYSEGMPSSLRLEATVSHREPAPGTPPQGADAETRGDADLRARAVTPRTDGSFSMIARSYVQFPGRHGQTLRLFDWPAQTYRKTFWKLLSYSDGGPVEVEAKRIYFGPISHDALEIGNNSTISFHLKRGHWQKKTANEAGKWISRYRVTVDLSSQHPGHRTAIANNIAQWIHEQSLMQRDAKDAIGCFFIGIQDPNARNSFLVRDPRLLCFLNTPLPLFEFKRTSLPKQ